MWEPACAAPKPAPKPAPKLAPKLALVLVLTSITTMKMNIPSQAMFSIAAIRLDVLVVSMKMSGRKRKVAAMYGARHAIQKYISKLDGGRFV